MKIDFTAFFIILILLPFFSLIKTQLRDKENFFRIRFPLLKFFSLPFSSFREKIRLICPLFFWIGWGLLIVAFIDPHQMQSPSLEDKVLPIEGMALFFLLDRSSSMKAVAKQEYLEGEWQSVTKFDFLKKVTQQFINEVYKNKKGNDLIGLIAFARTAQVITPLTFDYKTLLARLENLQIVKEPHQDGTGIGYAIYKTVHLMTATKKIAKEQHPENLTYLIKNAFLIVVTDGLQNPNPLDRNNSFRGISLEEAVLFAKKSEVKIYIINIEPSIKEEKFSPNRKQMEQLTQSTGGELIILDDLKQIKDTFKKINIQENQRIEAFYPLPLKKISFFPFFLKSAMILLVTSLLLSETFLRWLP